MVFVLIIRISLKIVLEAPQEYNPTCFFIPKEGNRIIYPLLQVAEADNIAKGLDGIENAICAGKRLDKTVHFEVFVYPQGIQCCGVKACQKHIDHDQKINLPVFHPQGNIFIVVLKFFAGSIIIGMEHLVIVPDGLFQKITGVLV